jgi:type I restriction enzyme, S subunit
MSKNSKSTAIPRVRFPEFRGDGAWERRKLSDLLIERKQRNRQLKYGPQEVLSVSGEYGCVNQIELLGRSYAGVSVKDYHVVEIGDIVYTKSPLKRNPFGIIKENKGRPGIVSTLYAVYRATDLGHPAFLDHYFSRDYNLNSYLQPIVRKGAKNDMKVNNAAVLGGEILAPKLEEQKKIAAYLTSLNEVIVAKGRKVEALKAYKRGLMQQLFPHEGEALPRLRFPEFYKYPEWTRTRLGKIAEFFKGKGVSKAELDPNGEIPCIRYGELYTRYGEKIETVHSRTNASVSELFLSRKNDVIIPGSGETKLDIAKASCVLNDGVALGGDLNVIRTKCDGVFLSYYLNGAKRLAIARVAQGDAVVHLYPSQLEQLEITIPEEIAEQKRIADSLSSLDAQITVESEKIGALKKHRNGLMQQLFPAPEET